MKVTLTFNLPKDEGEYTGVVNGVLLNKEISELKETLLQYHQGLRELLKDATIETKEEELLKTQITCMDKVMSLYHICIT